MQSLHGRGAIVIAMSDRALWEEPVFHANRANSLFIPRLGGHGTSAALGRPAPWAAVQSASLFPSTRCELSSLAAWLVPSLDTLTFAFALVLVRFGGKPPR